MRAQHLGRLGLSVICVLSGLAFCQAAKASEQCFRDNDTIIIRGKAESRNLELANGKVISVWVLATNHPICVLEAFPARDDLTQSFANHFQIIGSPPPQDSLIELKGTLTTGNVT